eukprot:9494650-Pyramimonas_sp.AAC.1
MLSSLDMSSRQLFTKRFHFGLRYEEREAQMVLQFNKQQRALQANMDKVRDTDQRSHMLTNWTLVSHP